MSDAPDTTPAPSAAGRLLVLIGGAALLVAVATDFSAVIGRHIGRPLLGSIEIVQAAVLVASSAAMLVATLGRRHAVVHLVVDRLPALWRGVLHRLAALLGAVLFAGLLAGAAWIAADMSGGHEESELLRIPYAPLRWIEIAALAAIALTFLVQAVRGGGRPRA